MTASTRIRRTSRPAPGAIHRGFTLMEIIVVVTIIALLAALVAPRLLGQLAGAKAKITQTKAANLAKNLSLYLVDSNLSAVPSSFDLEILRAGPDAGGGPSGPYLQKAEELQDAWGRKFSVRVPGEVNVDFDIVSLGEDGQPGGTGANADITQ